MKWQKRNPALNSVSEIVYSNTGMTKKEMEEEKEYSIYRMEEVASLIRDAVQNNRKICVVTDYDADGICSAAIVRLTLDSLGADSYIRIPRRMSEGYGLNPKILDEFPDGCLLICVDNGIVAFDALEQAKSRCMTTVVLDHHIGSEDGRLPNVDVLIDPSAIGEADFTEYCGAGIAYKLAVDVLGKSHPVVKKCLSFAAIATVADVVPLIGENRFIVKNGLKMMMTSAGRTKGLEQLIVQNGLEIAINEKNLGFKIAPCLNAPGRLYDDGAVKSYKLLVSDGSIETATAMAAEVISINEDRKTKKDEGVKKIEKNICENGLVDNIPLVIYEPDLAEGLVGLLAGHFAEEMKRPCIVFTDSESKDILKGSARSYGDIHIKKVLDENSDLIYKYGGHKGAAGLSIKKENLETFRLAMIKSLEGAVISDVNFYDIEAGAKDVPNLIKEMERFAPYGAGNPEIVFKINDFQVSPTQKGYVQTMSDGKHGKVVNRDGISAIAFGLGERLTEEVDDKPKILDFYGKLALNVSRFGSVRQIEVDDFEVHKTTTPTTSLASRLRKAAK